MPGDDRLDSWKAIAAYLGREVRTVQLWEKSEGLPIHRLQHARQGSVHAFRSELDTWRAARTTTPSERTAARRHWPLWAAVAGVLLAAAAALVWSRRQPPALPTSVVVLPFLDFSSQHDQDSFADSLTEEIITALSRLPNLRVVARTSAFSFKGRNVDVREIGRTLGVEAVLEGSVATSGDQVRITAQLNRASDGTHIWSRVYDRSPRDIFTVEDEIAQAIADELRVGAVPRRAPPTDVETWRLYVEARYFFNQFQPPDSNLKAIDRYEQAIGRDPNFALAYAGLADANAYLAENFVAAPRDVMPKAVAAAEKAVSLDPDSAEAQTSLAAVTLDYDWDIPRAQHELTRAMELNPGFGWARHWYGHSLEAEDRVADALVQMRAALALDPLNIAINWDVGAELISLHRYEEARAHLEKANELFPNVSILMMLYAESLYRLDRIADAHAVVEAMKKNVPADLQQPSIMAFVGASAAREGRRDEARRTLDALEKMRATEYVEPFMVIPLCSVLKDHAALARWMQRLLDDRSTLRIYMTMYTKDYMQDPDAEALAAALPWPPVTAASSPGTR